MPQYRTIPFNSACYSEVAQAGERTLCVTPDELVECGVTNGTIKFNTYNHRQGLVYCWPHHKEGNKVHLHFDGLKDIYKELIQAKLCNNMDAHLFVENREAQEKQKQLQRVCTSLPGMVEVYPEDIKDLEKTGYFTGEVVQRIARAAGWLRLWRKLDVKTARKMGFTSVTELQTKLFELCFTDQISNFVKFPKPIGCIRVLDRKAREFATGGLDVLIGGYIGNANRDKIDTLSHAILMDLACSPLKYSFEDMGMLYNGQLAPAKGLPKLTVSAIKQHLNKPVHKKVWTYARHGKNAGDDLYQPLALRETPSRPDALWDLDGTTMQLYYRDDNNKMLSDLYAYFVADASTGAIIGKSIAYAETSGMVVAALQDAIETTGHIPYQLQYDNSSANISDVVTGLMNNMSRVHFGCTPELGRAKYIEEIIGHFQQRVLRQRKNFKGSNVTSPSRNGKANPELLKWLKKNPQQLPTQEEVIQQFLEDVDNWNSRGEKRNNYGEWVGTTKMEKYNTPHADRVKVNYFDKLSLFMVELPKQKYEYTQQGIKLTLNGKKHYFIVPDPDNSANDFIFANHNMYAKFKVKINLNNPEYIILLDKDGKKIAEAYEKERFKACVADMKAGDGAKVKQFILKQQENGYDYCMKELNTQRQILFANGMKATGTGDFYGTCYTDKKGEYLGWRDMPKMVCNSVESREEDIENGVTERKTAVDSVLMALDNI